jgi:hypothetical protein
METIMDIFENASRRKLRFQTTVGELTTEQLWDLPLTSKGGRVNLDAIARSVHAELKGLEEVSFVECKPDPRKDGLELDLEILKHVIAVKLAEREEADKAATRAQRRAKLLDALASKENDELTGMSKDDILAELNSL